ncbi:MAG: DNA mismatch repair protein MutS [Bacillota bacterium]
MPVNATPMMRQYLELKEKYKDCLLFFRLGDFYEMFFEDALTASKELEIVLTGRDCGQEERAPMCGVPYHSVDSYINRLIKKGYKVAICEQLTDPSESKGLVTRDVIRVITPGTVIEESMLREDCNNYIVALFMHEDHIGLTYADISTGGFYVLEFHGTGCEEDTLNELVRIQPSEIIANDALFLRENFVRSLQRLYYIQCYSSEYAFEPARAEQCLLNHFKVTTLGGFGVEGMRYAISSAGALVDYLEQTQKNTLEHIRKIQVIHRSEYMALDGATRLNLELTRPLRFDGPKNATLLHLLDKTGTAMGGRLLRTWIDQPLQDARRINERLDAVDELFKNTLPRKNIAERLGSVYDMERLGSRIAYGTVNARDCVALMLSLKQLPGVIESVRALGAPVFERILTNLDPMEDICALLERAIEPEPPISVKEGGIIRDGYNEQVDAYRHAARDGKGWLAQMEAHERESTGIRNLKVGYNRVFGYFFEVTKSYQHLVPYHYQRKQTLSNAERYVTPELKELEETILGAEDKGIELEYRLFCEIRETLLACIERLQKNAALVAELDAYVSFAEAAASNRYCRPEITADGSIMIADGRHPVVERSIKDGFISNHTQLHQKDNRLQIITGPNMAGKSTYMRQVALIVLMAHIGCFVPASSARICIVDKLFTRVGASDNLAGGQSTFMVEMTEVANILNGATEKSLLILDEIGRGTSTFDGLSIAWAVLEHIADSALCGAKTLFSTHYHELTELEGKLEGVVNFRISVKEVGDDVIFLRKVVRGGADKSFGIQVARLAGLPDPVIARAKTILKDLENADINRNFICETPAEPQQITLFGSAEPDDIVQTLQGLDLNRLTPMDALSTLYDLQLRAKLKYDETNSSSKSASGQSDRRR